MKIFEVEPTPGKFNSELRRRLRGRSNFPLSQNEPDQEFDSHEPNNTLDLNTPVDQKQTFSKSSKSGVSSPTRFETENPRAEQFFNNFDKEAKDEITKMNLPFFYRKSNEGLDPKTQEVKWAYSIDVITKNNVRLSIGWANNNTVWFTNIPSSEAKEAVYSVMAENGFIDASSKRKDQLGGFSKPEQSKFKSIAEMANVIESLGPNFTRRSTTRSSRSRDYAPRKYYAFLARNIIDAWAHGQTYALKRGSAGGGFDAYDSLITIGYTRDGWANEQNKKQTELETGKSVKDKEFKIQREHVVPGDFIVTMCEEICEQNIGNKRRRMDQIPQEVYIDTLNKVADVINRNLAIVVASKSESDYIDNVMGWQTTMPPGWKDGMNILARFIQCTGYPNLDSKGIPVYSVKNGQRISENF